ncbi:MAG TPA: hypothetical protein VLH79_12695 [Chthonomonadales bacterium]|nr:hypothetical protein [Chthonomonadales bacterium]
MSAPMSRREAIAAAALPFAIGALGEQAAPEPVYPDDAFSRPPDDRIGSFDHASGLSLHLDVISRAEQYHEASLRVRRDGGRPRTEWRFRTRTIDLSALGIDERIRRPARALSMRVRNASAGPVRFELRLHELAWTPTRESRSLPWLAPTPPAVPAGAEQVVTFDLTSLAWPDRPTPALPRYPFIALLLLVRDVAPGALYVLELSDLTVHYPDPPGVRSAEVRVGRTLRAGAAVEALVRLDGDRDGRRVDLQLTRGAVTLWRARLGAAETRAAFEGGASVRRRLPWWVAEGDAEVAVAVGGYRLRGEATRTRVLNSRRSRYPRVERRQHRGRPTVFVDGRAFPWIGYSSYDYQPGPVADFGRHGVTVFCVPTNAARHIYHTVGPPTWPAPDRLDYGQIDERVAFTLEANPNARLTLRVALAMPQWWLQDHPDEVAHIGVGDGSLPYEEQATTRVGSLASEAWRDAQERGLRHLLRYCARQPWAGRLIGVWLSCGVTEEWFAWGANDGQLSDYSAPMQKAVRPALPAGVPPPSDRRRAGRDLYPDTEPGRRAGRYHRFQSNLVVETIERFARVVKEESDGRLLVAAFYGYSVQLAGEPRQSIAGHTAIRRALACPDIDMLSGVPLHDFRDLSHGYNPYIGPTESTLRAGKLYCNENDLFSWLHPLHWHVLYDPADPRSGAIRMHRRECANDCVRGALSQRFSLMASWHRDNALQAEFARQAAINTAAQRMDREPVEEVAFLVDDAGFAWAPPESALAAQTVKRLLHTCGRTGVPVGVWQMSDLARLPARIRFVVVANPWAAEDEAIAALAEALRQGGRHFLVVGAPGYVNEETGERRPRRPAEVLGLPVRVRDEPLPSGMLGGPVQYSDVGTVAPRAEAGAGATHHYADGAGAGAERPLPRGGRLLWFGAPPLLVDAVRRVMQEAGCHAYAPPGFFVHASRELVAITANVAGEAPLRWPASVRVADLFDGWSGAGAEMRCPFALGQTRLFRIVPRRGGPGGSG